MKSADRGYWWRVLIDSAGGGCWWRVLAVGAGTIFAGTLFAVSEVAAVNAAALRVFGVYVLDAAADRANVACVYVVDADAARENVFDVDAVDADRGYVAGVDFPEQKLMDRMLQLCHDKRALQWQGPSRCDTMRSLLTHPLIFVPGRSDLRQNIFMTKQSTAEKGSIQ